MNASDEVSAGRRERAGGRDGGRRPDAEARPDAQGAPDPGAAFESARAGRSRAGRRSRPVLSLDVLVDAAVRILDADGTEALTFRRLSTELKVGLASMYWYVESKDALLDIAVDRMFGPLADQLSEFDGSWQGRIRAAADRFFDFAMAHPWVGAQVLSSSSRGPSVLRIWEWFADVLQAAGFDPATAFHAWSAISTIWLGQSMQEERWSRVPSREAARSQVLDQMSGFLADLDADRYPALLATAPVFAQHTEREQFQASIELIVLGLERLAAGADRPG